MTESLKKGTFGDVLLRNTLKQQHFWKKGTFLSNITTAESNYRMLIFSGLSLGTFIWLQNWTALLIEKCYMASILENMYFIVWLKHFCILQQIYEIKNNVYLLDINTTFTLYQLCLSFLHYYMYILALLCFTLVSELF